MTSRRSRPDRRHKSLPADADGAYPSVVVRARIRNIIVDDVAYRWTVGQVDPGHVKVKVWRDRPDHGGVLEVVATFDDPWLNYGPIITAPAGRAAEVFDLNPITPALVATVVRQALDAGWQADHHTTMRLRLTRDRDRVEAPPG
jgi:hypothetical protein